MAKVALRFGCAKQSKKTWKVSNKQLLIYQLLSNEQAFLLLAHQAVNLTVDYQSKKTDLKLPNLKTA